MGACGIFGGALGTALNMLAEGQGLKPIKAGTDFAVELNPGFVVKQEILAICDPAKAAPLRLDLTKLSNFTQSYLEDRFEDVAGERMDKAWNIPGKRTASPWVPLGVIGLPGKGSAVIWHDKDEDGNRRLNGVLLKFQYTFD